MLSAYRSIRHWNRYREIITIFLRHGFGFALDQLEPGWNSLQGIFNIPTLKNIQTKPENRAMHFRLAMEELGPTFTKIGQILSTRPDLLPPAFITELSKLQDTVPPEPWEKIYELLTQELGKKPELVFSAIDPKPIAAASLAQVHTAKLLEGTEIVIKIQRPDIIPVIEVDLEILSSLAKRAQTTRWGKIYDFIEMADDFAFTLRNELNYRREGKNADRFRKNFSKESHLYIPRIYWDFSSERVLVLERINGIKIDDISSLDIAGYDRHKIALHSARITIKEVLIDGFFHADPHPGNYYVIPGEIIGAMDFGMVGYLRDKDRFNLIRLYLVSVALDAEGIVDQLIRMGAAGTDIDRLKLIDDINRLLNKYNTLALKEIRAREVIEDIMPIAFRHHLQLPSDLWLLGKTLIMLEGIGMQLDPDFDMFVVAQPFIRQLILNTLTPNMGWARSALLSGTNMSELFSRLLRAGNLAVDRIERNEPFYVDLNNTDNIMAKVDRLFTRLSLSILIGASIIGLSFLLANSAQSLWNKWIPIIGLFMIFIFGIGLFITQYRPRNK